MPHWAHRSLTADEVYFGTQPGGMQVEQKSRHLPVPFWQRMSARALGLRLRNLRESALLAAISVGAIGAWTMAVASDAVGSLGAEHIWALLSFSVLALGEEGHMKIIMFVILIAAAAALYHYKPWKSSSSATSTSSTTTEAAPTEFISNCSEHAPEDIDQPETFCRCMWNEGVRNPNFMANIQGRSAVSKCMGIPGL